MSAKLDPTKLADWQIALFGIAWSFDFYPLPLPDRESQVEFKLMWRFSI